MDMMLYGKRVDETELMEIMDNMLTASLVAIALSIPLMMAAWFSPLLVIFHNVPPILAMQKSFFACLKNIIPFQVYAITLVILTILAAMPYGLGLIVLIPTIFASIYVSYKDIFLSEPLIIQDSESKETMQQATWNNTDNDTVKKTLLLDADDEPTVKTDGDMVRCARCGVHFSKDEAIKFDGQYFCCDEHRHEHRSSTEN